ncbi:MAG: hypothetical protein NTX50_00390 [Candidatus Sumerlaeota bacterium]|nr:hypothetical protein [Candidatus Sumerlaeota bacterium]
MDEKTSKVLFTSKDVVRYDWERQVFELKREAAMELSAWAPPHMHQMRGFVVRDGEGIIYRGKMVSELSSIGYPGPILSDFHFPLEAHVAAPPLYQMQSAYPDERFGDNQVLLNDRLLAGLKKASVCGKIAPEYRPKPLEIVRMEWAGDKSLKVRAEIFAETLHAGQQARIHLFFANFYNYNIDADVAAIKLTLSANNKRFISETSLRNLPLAQVLEDGVWICRFKPWTPAPGSEDAVVKAGPAKLTVEVRLLEKLQDKPAALAQPRVVWSAVLPEAKVEILSARANTD